MTETLGSIGSMLEDAQIERYSRQIILPQVGGKGQEKLLRSQVYVDGDGLLAAAALFYLVAAGVGTIGVARAKAAPIFSVLAERPLGPDEQPVAHTLRHLNPDCTIVTHLDEDAQSLHHYDLILATTDALHAGWYAQHKPFVWGAASGEGARLFVSRGDRADRPCLRCLFPEHPPRPYRATPPRRGKKTVPSSEGCRVAAGWVPADTGAADPDDSSPLGKEETFPASAGQGRTRFLFSPYAFFLGTQLVTEALKIILQPEAERPPKLLAYTFPAFHCTEQTVEKNPHCPVCSTPVHD